MERSQWSSRDALAAYQLARLREVLDHCYRHVPFYRPRLEAAGLGPGGLRSLGDLSRLPLLSKDQLRRHGRDLRADNAHRFAPQLCRTSGTSAEPVSFLLDRGARVLEFCYYWRAFGWAGYRLREPFAEFSLHHFLHGRIEALWDRSRLQNRLILNPAQLSERTVGQALGLLERYRCRYLKASPSVLHAFALLVRGRGLDTSGRFRGLLTTGEKLHARQREDMERILGAPVFDSYGHMERTLSVSQCEYKKYHIHMDYGYMEVLPVQGMSEVDGRPLYEVVGTSLYNFAMPLVRYRTGDFVSMAPEDAVCPCGRAFPIVEEIIGREQDIIVTPDGRLIANLFIIFNFVDGIARYRLVQLSPGQVVVRLVKQPEASEARIEAAVRARLGPLLGPEVRVEVEFVTPEDLPLGPKHKPVESHVDPRDFT